MSPVEHARAMLADMEPTALGLLLVATAAAALLVPVLLSQLSFPRAFGAVPRPDLYTAKGSLPFLGLTVSVYKRGDRLPEYIVEMLEQRRKAGVTDPSRALSWTVPGLRFVALTQPHQLEYIQSTNFKNYVKGPLQRYVMGQVLGNGIFLSDGEDWHKQRKATVRIFNNSTYRGVITRSISDALDVFASVMDHFVTSKQEFAISDLFAALTLDIFSEMSFSTKTGAIEGFKDGRPIPFAQAFDNTQRIMARRQQQPFWPLLEPVDGTAKQMARDTHIVHSYAENLIEKRQAEWERKLASGEGEVDDGYHDLLTEYLKVRDEKGQGLSKETLRDATVNLLIAGRDTTAGNLAWTLFHLLSNPSLLEGLRREALELNDDRKLEFDRLREMHYAQAVWFETARLYPAVPTNFHTTVSDDKIPDGPRVEPGDLVCWSDWGAGRDKAIWGESAGVYDPSRWLDAEGRFKPASEFKMHAFNGGRRRCPGETLATFEGISILLYLVHFYDLAFADDYLDTVEMLETERCAGPSPRYRCALSLPMLEPLRVKVTRRKVDV
ncbi:hypothetical protein JCM8097_004946 [Rhodosporidiobolus ruineniae]